MDNFTLNQCETSSKILCCADICINCRTRSSWLVVQVCDTLAAVYSWTINLMDLLVLHLDLIWIQQLLQSKLMLTMYIKEQLLDLAELGEAGWILVYYVSVRLVHFYQTMGPTINLIPRGIWKDSNKEIHG